MPRSFPLLAACAVALLVVSGCDPDQPDPNYSSVTPTPSSSTTSPTPSNTNVAPNTTANVPSGAVEPTLPATAAGRTSDGALQFAAYYWRMVDWAYSTNSGDPIHGLYQPTCASCAAFESSISESATGGYTLVGGHISIVSLQIAGTDDVKTAQFGVDVALKVDALEARASGGALATSYPASAPTYRMYLAWVDGSWKIIESATVTTR